jgi:hypothetical protein
MSEPTRRCAASVEGDCWPPQLQPAPARPPSDMRLTAPTALMPADHDHRNCDCAHVASDSVAPDMTREAASDANFRCMSFLLLLAARVS